jgi:hypothetical protein
MASITGSKVRGDLRAGSARLVCRRTWAAALATLDQGSVRRWCTASGSGLAKMRPSVLMSVCSRTRVRDSGSGSGSLARYVRRSRAASSASASSLPSSSGFQLGARSHRSQGAPRWLPAHRADRRNFLRPGSRHHQPVPADRRRLLHLRRTVTTLAILEAA